MRPRKPRHRQDARLLFDVFGELMRPFVTRARRRKRRARYNRGRTGVRPRKRGGL